MIYFCVYFLSEAKMRKLLLTDRYPKRWHENQGSSETTDTIFQGLHFLSHDQELRRLSHQA
jgi:hypothetical protein